MHKILDTLLAALAAARTVGPRIEVALKDRMRDTLDKLDSKAINLRSDVELDYAEAVAMAYQRQLECLSEPRMRKLTLWKSRSQSDECED